MSNILLLSLQQVAASVEADEDFGPWTMTFFEADGVTPIDLAGISFTATIGPFQALTSGAGGALTVSGNTLTLFLPAAQKNWATGRYSFSLLASDGTYTRDILANSTVIVGAPAAFSVSAYSSGGSANALSNLSGAALLALLELMGTISVNDGESAPFAGAVALTVGTTYAAQRSVGVLCTVAGNVEFQFPDGSTLTLPVYVGWKTFPFAVTQIVAAGTTATATYFNLK